MGISEPNKAELHTRNWIEKVIVGLNLCPFSKPVVENGGLRIKMSAAKNPETLYQEFLAELLFIAESSPEDVETSLLIFPMALTDFEEYLGFLELANECIAEAELEGDIQLASFHPDYQFQGESSDAVSNFTNRSPYPMLHFLREESLTKALEKYPNPEEIPERNMQLMEEMGLERMKQLFESCKVDD